MKSKLPSYFKPLFWSYDFSRIDAEKDKRRVVIDTINHGNWRHWKWIFDNYGKKAVKEIVEAVPETEFRPGAFRLVSLLLSITKTAYASRSAYTGRN